MRFQQIVKASLVLLLVVGGAWIVKREVTERRIKTEEARQERERREKTKQAIAEMVSRHGALSHWADAIAETALTGQVYSVELEEAMVKGEKPILIFATLSDIVRKGAGKYLFTLTDETSVGLDLYYFLEADADAFALAKAKSQNLSERFAVIALISEVHRPPLKVTADDSDYELSFGTSSAFVATGRCLEVLPIQDYHPAQTAD